MKEFTTPLSIVGSIEEIHKIIPNLEALGYTMHNKYDSGRGYTCLLTQFGSNIIKGRLGYNQAVDPTFITVNIIHRELILALAAMVKGDIFYKGEYLKCIKDHSSLFTKNKLYKQRRDQSSASYASLEKDDSSVPNGIGAHFTKATVEEICKYFNQKIMEDTSSRNTWQDIEESMSKDTPKKIIGWDVKPGIDRIAALKAIDWEENRRDNLYELKHESEGYYAAKRLGVLDALFTPIYKEDKKIVNIGLNEYKIYSDYIVYNHSSKLYRFTKGDLEQLISVYGGNFSIAAVSYSVDMFRFGCNGQIKVSLDDIRMLLSYFK